MEDFLLKIISEEECIASWKGPLNSSHDFIFNNFRFEVKSSSNDNNSVKINSLNQLDPNEKIYLWLEIISQKIIPLEALLVR